MLYHNVQAAVGKVSVLLVTALHDECDLTEVGAEEIHQLCGEAGVVFLGGEEA